jgi:hypothetical protein
MKPVPATWCSEHEIKTKQQSVKSKCFILKSPFETNLANVGSSDNPIVKGYSDHKFFLVTENPLGGVDQICMRISMPFNIYMVILTVG